jgi:TolA-binding protein
MLEPRQPAAKRMQARPPNPTAPVFQHYQAAVQLLQQGKYEKALAAFEKLLPEAPPKSRTLPDVHQHLPAATGEGRG